jgi:hypothetical protein
MKVYSLIFIPVFHRILDFKNGAGFLSRPLFFLKKLKIENRKWKMKYTNRDGIRNME